MKPATALALLLVASPALAAPDVPACPSADEKPDVPLLVKRTEKLLEGSSLVATMVMTITTPKWTRTLKLRTWTKGRDLSLVRVLEGGPRETGMMTLKRQKQLWNWLPQAGKVMKLPDGMLGDSWMGSDLTNDDLVRGSSLADDFDASIDRIDKRAGGEAWHVVLQPKPDAPVVWGRIEMLIDRATCVPLEERFFDEDRKAVRTLTFADHKQIGWRSFPQRVTVTPDGEGRATTMQYEDVQFDVDIPDDTFSVARLRGGR